MLTLEPKSQSASGTSTMPMEIGMTGHPGSPLLTGRRSVENSVTELLQLPASNMSTRFADSNPSSCDGIPGLVVGTAAAIDLTEIQSFY